MLIHPMGNADGKLTCDASQKYIRFCGGMVTRSAPGNTHIDFEMIDGTFYNRSDLVGVAPFLRVTLDTREHA